MEPLAPEAPDFVDKAGERTRLAGEAVVGVVALELATQRRLLGRHRPVAVRSAPVTDVPQGTGETVLGRLALHYPTPLPGAPPEGGEPQQHKAALALRAAWPGPRWTAKVHQSGLLGVQPEAVLAESLWQDLKDPPPILFPLEAPAPRHRQRGPQRPAPATVA
jgi:hypothetical protein